MKYNNLMRMFAILLVITIQGGGLCAEDIKLSKKISVGAPLDLIPYVIPDSMTGIELDIVRHALAKEGYSCSVTLYPYLRVMRMLRSRQIDAALTVSVGMVRARKAEFEGLFFSDSHLAFSNVAISLKKKGLHIEVVEDLGGHIFYSFLHAKRILGPSFASFAEKNANYHEFVEADKLISLLFLERADVIIMDLNKFKYYRSRVANIDTARPVKVHKIFPPGDKAVGFTDSKVRDAFNAGVKKLKEAGEYQKIFDLYLNEPVAKSSL